MKTKVLLVSGVFSVISFVGISQGLKNESAYGFSEYTSFVFSNNFELERSPRHGNDRNFNFAFIPSAENEPQGVDNQMKCTGEITVEQVELIFDMAKEFPEDTEVSIAFINNDRVFFYGLKRQNNTIINIDNHSACEYTSATAINIKNETGIVILSNVPKLNKKMRNIDTLCLNLLATLKNAMQ